MSTYGCSLKASILLLLAFGPPLSAKATAPNPRPTPVVYERLLPLSTGIDTRSWNTVTRKRDEEVTLQAARRSRHHRHLRAIQLRKKGKKG
jgi:hypothetical protein